MAPPWVPEGWEDIWHQYSAILNRDGYVKIPWTEFAERYVKLENALIGARGGMADTTDSKSVASGREGSSPSEPTSKKNMKKKSREEREEAPDGTKERPWRSPIQRELLKVGDWVLTTIGPGLVTQVADTGYMVEVKDWKPPTRSWISPESWTRTS